MKPFFKSSFKLPTREVLHKKLLVRKFLLTGLLVWIPLITTLWVLGFVVGLMDSTLLLLPDHWQPGYVVGFDIPGLGVLLALVVLFVTGMLGSNVLGRAVFKYGNAFLERVPFFNVIYTSVKQVSDTLLSSKGQAFRQAVLIPYPHPGVWVVGFLTGDPPLPVSKALGQTPHLSVYVPTALSPTSGFVVLVPEADILPSGLTVDEALRYVVSMGVVTPPLVAEPQVTPHANDL
ncbi:MAG: DUF502 domain-containing protein [Limnobacter sp.]|nr:DUF502 domain-containing protein [Limnobacter sp.]